MQNQMKIGIWRARNILCHHIGKSRNIKNSVEGIEVDAKQLSTSQWVITSIISLDRAASGEEAALTKIRLEGKRDDSD